MKIKHFIVTYNNKVRINSSLRSIFESKSNLENVDFYVLNNHSEIRLNEEYKGLVKVIDNQARPDFSTGHMARSWNQAIINGFEDLNNPSCDILIATQDDTIVSEKYIEKTIALTQKFDYVSFGTGDQFNIYTPRAIKKLGLWDERICNIGYHEADYFLRAIRYHGDGVSINDHLHGRVHNPIHDQKMNPITHTPSGISIGDPAHIRSLVFHGHSHHVFWTKWEIRPMPWDLNNMQAIRSIEPKMMSYIFYPYFEKDVETLREQKYLII